MYNKITKLSLPVVLTITNVAAIGTASAHGWAEFPPSRSIICHNDGNYWGGQAPNQACRTLFAENGGWPFTQKNENAANTINYPDIEAVKVSVPNGLLCAGGDTKKDGLDIPSVNWQKTALVLDANGEFDFVWTATAPHNPSYWEFYLTKPDHDFSKPLNWDDLELVYEVGNVMPQNGSPYKTYNFKVKLPTDRTGDAILYTRWQRIDAAGEGFYNCSDVVLEQSGSGDEVKPPLDEGNMFAIPGYFVPVGYQTPLIGDTVRFRLMAPVTGKEVFDHRLVITAANQETWIETFAYELNALDANKLFIGIWNKAAGKYEFDAANLHANKVWVDGKDYAFAVTTFTADDTLPPVEPEEPDAGDIPAYESGKAYKAGDKVLARDGNVYQCKPWPYTAWCAQSAYEPAESNFWSDAWDKL